HPGVPGAPCPVDPGPARRRDHVPRSPRAAAGTVAPLPVRPRVDAADARVPAARRCRAHRDRPLERRLPERRPARRPRRGYTKRHARRARRAREGREGVTTLVTGAAGFIGFHVAKRLLADGHQVVGLDNLNSYYDPTLKQARLDQLT